MQKQKKMKYLKVNFNMIESDKQFYLKHCNFNELQERIFNYMTNKHRLSIIQIADKEHISTRTVDRHIRNIKIKMLVSLIKNK